MKKSISKRIFRGSALLVLLIGAAGSLSLMLHEGRYNKSIILIAVFVAWVLSPFIALFAAFIVATRWPLLPQMALFALIAIISIGALLCYTRMLSVPGTKPAFIFLVFPLLSWLLICAVLPMAFSMSRRRSARKESIIE